MVGVAATCRSASAGVDNSLLTVRWRRRRVFASPDNDLPVGQMGLPGGSIRGKHRHENDVYGGNCLVNRFDEGSWVCVMEAAGVRGQQGRRWRT